MCPLCMCRVLRRCSSGGVAGRCARMRRAVCIPWRGSVPSLPGLVKVVTRRLVHVWGRRLVLPVLSAVTCSFQASNAQLPQGCRRCAAQHQVAVCAFSGVQTSRLRDKLAKDSITVDTVHGLFCLHDDLMRSARALLQHELVLMDEFVQLGGTLFQSCLLAWNTAGRVPLIVCLGDWKQLQGMDDAGQPHSAHQVCFVMYADAGVWPLPSIVRPIQWGVTPAPAKLATGTYIRPFRYG